MIFRTCLLILSALMITFIPATAQEYTRSKTFPLVDKPGLEIELPGYDIRIRAGSSDKIEITARVTDEEELERIIIEQKGKTIRVEYEKEIFSTHFKKSVRLLEVKTPENLNLTAQTSGGDVSIVGKAAGEIIIKTSGGDITAEDLTGKVKLTTAGGDIEVKNTKGELRANTSGGDIKSGDVDGSVKASTSGGDITVRKVTGDIEASTSGGDIMVSDVGGDARLSSTGGDIRTGKIGGKAELRTVGGKVYQGYAEKEKK